MLYYCKDTGEDMKPDGTCLLHGKQPIDHFEKETENIKKCVICGDSFFCMDDIRKVCTVKCARKFSNKQHLYIR